MDEAELRRRVAEARVARLATIEADGRAHLVPICFAVEEERLYSAVDQKPKRSRDLRRLRNLRERPWATVLVDHYEEDWSRLWWARLRGPARILDGGEEAAARSTSWARSTPSTGGTRRPGRSSRWTSSSGARGPRGARRPAEPQEGPR